MTASTVSFFQLAVKQFGAGALIAGVFGVATMRVYDDLGKRNDVLVALIREQVVASERVAESLHAIADRVQELKK